MSSPEDYPNNPVHGYMYRGDHKAIAARYFYFILKTSRRYAVSFGFRGKYVGLDGFFRCIDENDAFDVYLYRKRK